MENHLLFLHLLSLSNLNSPLHQRLRVSMVSVLMSVLKQVNFLSMLLSSTVLGHPGATIKFASTFRPFLSSGEAP
jgi:hypothetical protein